MCWLQSNKIAEIGSKFVRDTREYNWSESFCVNTDYGKYAKTALKAAK